MGAREKESESESEKESERASKRESERAREREREPQSERHIDPPMLGTKPSQEGQEFAWQLLVVFAEQITVFDVV